MLTTYSFITDLINSTRVRAAKSCDSTIQLPYNRHHVNRSPENAGNDDENNETLVQRQAKVDRNYDIIRNYNSIPIGSTAVV